MRRFRAPTLELLQVYSLDISAGQVLYMCDQRLGILLGSFWKRCNEVLEVRIGPGVACQAGKTLECVRILRLS
jgi:hypothetical protein